MISEAAYYLAERRGFQAEHAIDDWLAAELQVRLVISPILDSEVTMNDTGTKADQAPRSAPDASKQRREAAQQPEVSRYEKYAATQAAGDGIEGDVLKPNKTTDDKISANMADRK